MSPEQIEDTRKRNHIKSIESRNPESAESRRKRNRERKRLLVLKSVLEGDPDKVRFNPKTHALVALAIGGITNHEREAAKVALRKRGLL